MKVLFTHSYFLHFDVKQLQQSKPYPPLATLVAASYIRANGYEVYFHDVLFEKSGEAILSSLEKIKPDVLVIYDDGFNYLTKMCLTNMRHAAQQMTSFAKERGIKVIISSSDSTDHYQGYLQKGADVILLGEAEDSLAEVLHKWKHKEAITDVAGIATLLNGSIKKNDRRLVRTDLDALPFAAWDLLDITPYKASWKKHGYFSINMATTRGCPFKCNWCAKPIYGNRYNTRSPELVVEELALMYKLFQFDHVWFSDDIFGLKPGWVQSFNKVLQQTGLKFSFKIQMRADLLLKDDTIKNLAESGCDEVWIGAESGSQKILDAMDKGTLVEQIYDATNMMKAFGIKPCFFLQLGYLGEEKEDIDHTLKMLFDLMPYDIGVSVSYPLPGTGFYEKVKEQLTQKANWTDSDELLLMYKGTFTPAYYKSLHRYIHKKFRGRQALTEIKKIIIFKSVQFKKALSYFYFAPASMAELFKLRSLQATDQ